MATRTRGWRRQRPPVNLGDPIPPGYGSSLGSCADAVPKYTVSPEERRQRSSKS
ncbi:hypothetical protein MtrunA17_Chr4g0050211 [Medicago truncatula]|uniref:Uncharacterized protein n=1 Tax=Medicago truncatula TaxID=3880 RepID=A0A396IAQ5_MEDTR|nr:hypothetical protein MtrunA17_Chr4g0050211 [Medicago truncatula]